MRCRRSRHGHGLDPVTSSTTDDASAAGGRGNCKFRIGWVHLTEVGGLCLLETRSKEHKVCGQRQGYGFTASRAITTAAQQH